MIVVKLFHGNELEEDAIVNHQAHGRVVGIVLQTEESLGRIVCFHIMHTGGRDKVMILFFVRSKGNASVEEYLQIGPYFAQIVGSGKFYHSVQYRHHPRGNTA